MAINRAPFNALVDDDGSNSVGSIWNKNQIKTVILDPVDAALVADTQSRPGVAVVSTVGNIPSLALPSGSTGHLITYMINTSLATIQGMAPSAIPGQLWTIYTAGGGQVDFSHNDAAATGAKVINFATSGKTSLAGATSLASPAATFQYHSGVGWRMVAHEQGAWITPAYSGAAFTSNVGSWTVDAGDVTRYAYRLSGKTLTVSWYLQTTSVAGAPTVLKIAVPGGFTIVGSSLHPIVHDDAGAGNAGSFCLPGGTTIDCYKAYGVGSFAAATNTTRLFGTITFEVN